jgi:LacI family transcriptional regulator
VDNYVPNLPLDAILCDNFEGARKAVSYLIDQGHRRIGFIGGPLGQAGGPRPTNSIYTFEQRALGYFTALLDANLPIDYNLYGVGSIDTEGGYEACKQLLARNELFTALFCANDAKALGALKALREAGLRVPEDVSLIGFDDLDMVEHLTPSLTTVRIYKEAIGSTAVKTLLLRAADMEARRVTSTLDVELIIRDSVRLLTS